MVTKHMPGKNLFEGRNGPQTQSLDAVRALLSWRGHPTEPMPSSVALAGGLMLVRNSKGDAYYTVTPTACSCPSAQYRPGKPCKHRRQYFPQTQPAKLEAEPVDSIRPDMRGFRPVSLLPGETEEEV